jgi:hypothetical protein
VTTTSSTVWLVILKWTSTQIPTQYGIALCLIILSYCSDDLLQGSVEELDLGSDEPELVPSKHKKSKQHAKPARIIPTGSYASSSDSSDSEGDDDGHTTMANMEARSRALDAKAAREADLDAEEMQLAALGNQEDEGSDVDMDGEIDDDDDDAFQLPTTEEREQEKKAGGPDVHIVQRRMRECARVLGNFKKLAAKGRSVFMQSIGPKTIIQLLISQVTLRVHRTVDIGHSELLRLQ